MSILRFLILMSLSTQGFAAVGTRAAAPMTNIGNNIYGINMNAISAPLEHNPPSRQASEHSILSTPTTAGCGSEPFWINWAQQLNGSVCTQKVNAVISLELKHFQKMEKLKEPCECFFTTESLNSDQYKQVQSSVRRTPADKNFHAIDDLVTNMRNGMFIQASMLSSDNGKAIALAGVYSQTIPSDKDSETSKYQERIDQANLEISKSSSPNIKDKKFEPQLVDLKKLGDRVEGSCVSKLQFSLFEQIPDKKSSTIYDSLNENQSFNPKDWNFKKLITEFNKKSSLYPSLSDALKSSSEITKLKDKLDFLKKNPLYLNLFSSEDASVKQEQEQLFQALQKSFNNPECRSKSPATFRRCVFGSTGGLQDTTKDIFQKANVQAAVNTQGLNSLDSFLSMVTKNAEILEMGVVTDHDINDLATMDISKIEERVSICDNINSSTKYVRSSEEADGLSRPVLDLQAEWASDLSLDDVMKENKAFQKFHENMCLKPRLNKEGKPIIPLQHMNTICPPSAPCSIVEYKKRYKKLIEDTEAQDPNDENLAEDMTYRETKQKYATLSGSDYIAAASVQNYVSSSYDTTPVTTYDSPMTAAQPFRGSIAETTSFVDPIAAGPQQPSYPVMENFPPNGFFPPPAQPTTIAAPVSSVEAAHADKSIEDTRSSIRETERELAATSADNKRVKDLEDQLSLLKDQLKKFEQSRVTETASATQSAVSPPVNSQSAAPSNSSRVSAPLASVANATSSNVVQAPAAQNFAPAQSAFSGGSASSDDGKLGSAKSSRSSGGLSGASLGRALGTGGAAAGASASGGSSSIYMVNPGTSLTVSSDSTPSQDLAITVSSQEYQTLEGFRQGTTTQLDPQLIEKLQAQLGTIPTSKINLSFTAPDGQILKFDVTKGENGLAFLPLDASGRAPASAAQPAAPAKQSKLYENLLNTLDNSAR